MIRITFDGSLGWMMISTQDLLILIGCALASGVGMAALGVLLEFVLRKKHPAPLPAKPLRGRRRSCRPRRC